MVTDNENFRSLKAAAEASKREYVARLEGTWKNCWYRPIRSSIKKAAARGDHKTCVHLDGYLMERCEIESIIASHVKSQGYTTWINYWSRGKFDLYIRW